MQTIEDVFAFKQTLRAYIPQGMLRWDRTGRALLVSDAPRWQEAKRLAASVRQAGYHAWVNEGMLYVDLAEKTYETLGRFDFKQEGSWDGRWWKEQAVLSSILSRQKDDKGCPVQIGLLRKALLACVQGEVELRGFLATLAPYHASALRSHETCTLQAVASLCAYAMWEQYRVGLLAAVLSEWTIHMN